MRHRKVVHEHNWVKDLLGCMNLSDDYHRGALYPFAFLFIFNVDSTLHLVMHTAKAVNNQFVNFVIFMAVALVFTFLQMPLMFGFSPYFPRWTLLVSAFFQAIAVSLRVAFFKEQLWGTYMLYYVCNMSGFFLVLSTLLQYFVLEDNHHMLDRYMSRLIDIDPRQIDYNPHREIENGTAWAQFKWPRSDLDRGQVLPIPAKVLASMFLTVIVSTSTFSYIVHGVYRIVLRMDPAVIADTKAAAELDKHANELLDKLLSTFKYNELVDLSYCVYCSSAVCYTMCLYSAFIQPMVWRKKLLELIYGNPSYTYHADYYSIDAGVRFIGTVAFYIYSATMLQFGLLTTLLYLPYNQFLRAMISKYYPKLVGMLIYLLLALVVLRKVFINNFLSNKDFIHEQREWIWNITYWWFEMLYLPKSIGYFACSFIFNTLFWIFSGHRPDINRMGNGMQGYGMGHRIYLCNVRLYMTQMMHRYYGFPEALSPDDEGDLQARIAVVEADLELSKAASNWGHCCLIQGELDRLKLLDEHMLWEVPLGTRVIILHKSCGMMWYCNGVVASEDKLHVCVEYEDPLFKICGIDRIVQEEFDKLAPELVWKMTDEVRKWQMKNHIEDTWLDEAGFTQRNTAVHMSGNLRRRSTRETREAQAAIQSGSR